MNHEKFTKVGDLSVKKLLPYPNVIEALLHDSLLKYSYLLDLSNFTSKSSNLLFDIYHYSFELFGFKSLDSGMLYKIYTDTNKTITQFAQNRKALKDSLDYYSQLVQINANYKEHIEPLRVKDSNLVDSMMIFHKSFYNSISNYTNIKDIKFPISNSFKTTSIKKFIKIRELDDYKRSFLYYQFLFFFSFILISFSLSLMNISRGQFIIPCLLLISSFGVAEMISLYDPLRDSLKFTDFIKGYILFGMILFSVSLIIKSLNLKVTKAKKYSFICVILLSAIIILYHSIDLTLLIILFIIFLLFLCVIYFSKISRIWIFEIFKNRNNLLELILENDLKRIFIYSIITFILLFLLYGFGKAPSGDAKINLAGFQPFEIIKLLSIVVISIYFSKYWRIGELLNVINFLLLFVILSIIAFVILGNDFGNAILPFVSFSTIILTLKKRFLKKIFLIIFGLIFYFTFIFLTFLFLNKNLWYTIINSIFLLFILISVWSLNKYIIPEELKRQNFLNILFWRTFFKKPIYVIYVLLFLCLFTLIPINVLNIGNIQDIAIRKIDKPLIKIDKRIKMAYDPFTNGLENGDQIARSQQAMSSGHKYGQGFGNGYRGALGSDIPAAETDMIIIALSEEIGFSGLICLFSSFFCLFYLLYISTLNKYNKIGFNYPFILSIGFLSLLFFQFSFISMGSIGILPLTGIPVPFLSYGSTAIVSFLFIILTIVGFSNETDENKSIKEKLLLNFWIKRDLSKKWFWGLVFLLFPFMLLAFKTYNVMMIQNQNILSKPIITSDKFGNLEVHYNIRLLNLLDEIGKGVVYDCNNIPVAYDFRIKDSIVKKVKFEWFKELNDKYIKTFKNYKFLKRVYPFDSSLSYLIGDINPGRYFLYWNSDSNFQLIEKEYSDLLIAGNKLFFEKKFSLNRSVDTTYCITRSSYNVPAFFQKVIKFPDTNKVYYDTIINQGNYTKIIKSKKIKVNYEDLATMYFHNEIKEGIKNENRDLHITINSILQSKIKEEFYNYASVKYDKPDVKHLHKFIQKYSPKAAGVVILNENGQIISSVNYPNSDFNDFSRMKYNQPGSVMKVLTYAAAYKYNVYDSLYSAIKYISPTSKKIEYGNFVYFKSNKDFIKEMIPKPYPPISLRRALPPSKDFPFAKAAWDIKADRFYDVCNLFHLKWLDSGLRSTKEQFIDYLTPKDNQYRYNLPRVGVGEYNIGATVLNMARVAFMIANKGKRYIGDKSLLNENPIYEQFISKNEANTIADAMWDVCNNKEGTAKQLKDWKCWGKTGTPDNVVTLDKYYKIFKVDNSYTLPTNTQQISDYYSKGNESIWASYQNSYSRIDSNTVKVTTIWSKHTNHTWFIGFTEINGKKFTFAICLQHMPEGHFGGNIAAPFATKIIKILKEYYARR